MRNVSCTDFAGNSQRSHSDISINPSDGHLGFILNSPSFPIRLALFQTNATVKIANDLVTMK